MSFIKTPRIFYHGFQIVCFSCRNALMRIVSQIYLAPFFVIVLQIWKSGKSPIPSPNIQQMFEQLSPNKFWGSVWVGFKKYRVGMPWCVVLRCPCLVLSSTLLAVFWIDCCGCHQCTYRFEHRLRTLEMRVDFCIFAVSGSETCVFFVCFCITCIIILINWWYYWCFFPS